MYLAAIIDWHSKAILSYKLSNSMDGTLVTDVLKEALRSIKLHRYLIVIKVVNIPVMIIYGFSKIIIFRYQ